MTYFMQTEKDLCIMVCAPTTFEMQMKEMTSICLLGGECTWAFSDIPH